MMRDYDKKRKEKREKDMIEAYILAVMEKSLKTAIDKAMKDIFKDFK